MSIDVITNELLLIIEQRIKKLELEKSILKSKGEYCDLKICKLRLAKLHHIRRSIEHSDFIYDIQKV